MATSSSLDMSLDDIIRSNKQKTRGSNSRDRAPRSSGPSRRIPNRFTNRTTPYAKPFHDAASTWQHDMFMEDAAAFSPHAARFSSNSNEAGIKVLISNLDYGVSDEDIKELFSEAGDVKRYAVHYDRSGRSKGTAEVVYSRRVDALQAVKKYNNVQLDGKPMKVEIVGQRNIPFQTPAHGPATNAMYDSGVRISGQARTGAAGQPRGSGRGRRGRGGNRNHAEKVSAEDLDADLDKYHAEGMETN
ncbi:hypothetical protein L6164_009895 [Bauhinia variegata]|uniref:Uncharacterized protein n=1 Tax=Bauhinia variegata TaxID=167791 RepID=A0ACB9PLF4_BAUVA|nr:hypothetical protein L6164_009895 [Bauhinia variegata]